MVEGLMTAKLLLIEDDSDIAEVITAELAGFGFQIERAADGIEGLDKARSLRPDAMIVDRSLPGMDGLAVIEAVVETTAERFSRALSTAIERFFSSM
jgi:two-component system, OmpR family, response regulator